MIHELRFKFFVCIQLRKTVPSITACTVKKQSLEPGGEKLSWQHGVKLWDKVGCNSVKFALRMNSAVVIFLDSVDKVNSVVKSGVVICDLFTQVLPLVSPANKDFERSVRKQRGDGKRTGRERTPGVFNLGANPPV